MSHSCSDEDKGIPKPLSAEELAASQSPVFILSSSSTAPFPIMYSGVYKAHDNTRVTILLDGTGKEVKLLLDGKTFIFVHDVSTFPYIDTRSAMEQQIRPLG